MTALFELEWLGGAAARTFRQRRPGIDDLPWGSLDPKELPPVLVDRARLSWTEGAYAEYATAAAFAELLGAMLAAGAPVDLIGMAGDFVADEMVHVELNARMAMELGGGVAYPADLTRLAPVTAPGLSPLARASELAVRISCVGEALSVPLLAGSMRAADHPLTAAVLERIAQDEAPHARLGFLYLEWAGERMEDDERARLAAVALAALGDYRSYWEGFTSRAEGGVTAEGFRVADVHRLGWMDSETYVATARRAVRDKVVAPLAAAAGIVVPAAAVAELLGEASAA